jgi:hypothetical protein
MDARYRPYPRYYRRLLPKGQVLKKEELNDHHVRLYLLDRHRRLRLIFIHDGSLDRQYVLTEKALIEEFGVSYPDLVLGSLEDFFKLKTLDFANTWPARLYPKGAPGTKAVLKKAQQAARQRAAAFRVLNVVMPVTVADAWI